MELLNNDLISNHFLTPKDFKSMKFVGHCSSVLKSFKSNLGGIASTLEKLATPEANALQETILNLDFVMDYLFMPDVMSHLTSCSEIMQQGHVLP